MGRPKGSKNKVEKEVTNAAPLKKEEKKEVNVPRETSAPIVTAPKIVIPDFDPTTHKLFEAPDGYMMIGEKDSDRVWYRKGNNGQGCWINPYRAPQTIEDVARENIRKADKLK